MKTKQEIARELVSSHVYANQTILIQLLLEMYIEGTFKPTSPFIRFIEDYYYSNLKAGDSYDRHYWEWYLVSNALATNLVTKKEYVMQTNCGNWWLRKATGSAVYIDDVIQDIANDLLKLRTEVNWNDSTN